MSGFAVQFAPFEAKMKADGTASNCVIRDYMCTISPSLFFVTIYGNIPYLS